MRYIFCVLVFVSLACKHDSPPPTENDQPIENEQESPISLKFGEIAIVKSLNLRVGFRDVNDSRCPEKVECFWEGIAYLRLWLLPTNSDTVFIQPSIYGYVTRNDSTMHLAIDTIGFRIKLLQLDPYPIYPSSTQKVEYIALLEISKN
jgi:hypothetical protein